MLALLHTTAAWYASTELLQRFIAFSIHVDACMTNSYHINADFTGY